MFPHLSMTATFTAGVMGRFGVVLLGSTMNFGSIQAPGLTPNDPLVTDAMPSADASSRYPLPAFLMVKPENVATPATALASCGPPNAPPPGFAFGAMSRWTVPVKPVIVLPWPSLSVTSTGAMVESALVVVGGWVNARWLVATGRTTRR